MPRTAQSYRRRYKRIRSKYGARKTRRRGNLNSSYRAGASRQLNNSIVPWKYSYVRTGDEIRWQSVDIAAQSIPRINQDGLWPSSSMLEINVGEIPVVTKATGPGTLMDIDRSTGVHDRLGSKVMIKRMRFSLNLRMNPILESTNYLAYEMDPVRIMVIAVRNNGATFAPSGFQQFVSYGLPTSRGAFNATFRKQNGSLYRVLYDRVHNLQDSTYAGLSLIADGSTTSNILYSRGRSTNLTIDLKPNVVVNYNDASTTGTYSERDISIFIACFCPYVANAAASPYTVAGNCVTWFTP